MLPARTVKASPLLAPFDVTFTTTSPVLAAAPSWNVILVLVQIG
jgi:hypothetical protein